MARCGLMIISRSRHERGVNATCIAVGGNVAMDWRSSHFANLPSRCAGTLSLIGRFGRHAAAACVVHAKSISYPPRLMTSLKSRLIQPLRALEGPAAVGQCR